MVLVAEQTMLEGPYRIRPKSVHTFQPSPGRTGSDLSTCTGSDLTQEAEGRTDSDLREGGCELESVRSDPVRLRSDSVQNP